VIRVNIKLFASARDLAKTDHITLSLPDRSKVADVFICLSEMNSEFRKWEKHLRFAVNWEYVPNDCILHDNDEVAVIPPVSGG